MIHKNIFAILLVILTSPFTLKAQEVREFYTGIRGLGMGGAGIATVNDETALLINPAGLGKLRDSYGTIIDPELDLSNNSDEIYKGKAFSDPFSMKAVGLAAVAKPDFYYHARGQIFPSFVVKNFGIGIFAQKTLNTIYVPTAGALDMFYRDDFGLAVGYNFRFWGGRIKFGVNGKLISRIELDERTLSADPETNLDQADLISNNYLKEGVGTSFDAALILAAPWTFLPTAAAVVRDVGGTTFDKIQNQRLNANARPTAQRQDMDVALALFPIHTNHTRSAWTVEYKKLLTNGSDPDKTRYMHGGFELNVSDIFFLRAGYHQKYWTAGIEISSEHLQFQVASYGEDVFIANEYREDRRYAAKFAFRF